MARTACGFTLVALAACSPTAYHRPDRTGGYSELQLGDNLFQVRFEANGFTPAARASDFALLRSAEVTLERGFNFFVITNGESIRTVSVGAVNNVAYVVEKPSTTNLILCFKDPPEGTHALVYDAGRIRRVLRDKYQLDGAPPSPPPPPARLKPVDPYAREDD